MSTAYIKPGHQENLVTVDSSVNNIPAAYSAAAGSAIRKNGNANHTNFAIVNYTGAALAVSLDGGVSDSFLVPASNSSGPGVTLIDAIVVGKNTSIRSLSGVAVVTGLVYLMVW